MLCPSKTGWIEYICDVKVDIAYVYQTDFSLQNEEAYSLWLQRCAAQHGAKAVQLAYAFMDDEQLFELNQKYLKHDTLTDIITFDDSVGSEIDANIAISIERVSTNAQEFSQSFQDELLRVMAHGLLHCLGFGDKSTDEKKLMRAAEDKCIQLFHVEQKSEQHVC